MENSVLPTGVLRKSLSFSCKAMMEFAYNINSRYHCVHQNTSLTVVGVSPWRKWCYLIQLPCPFLVQIFNNSIFSAFQRLRVFLRSLIWLGETRSGSAGPAVLTVWSHISSYVSYMYCRCSLLTILLSITSSRTLAFPPQLLVLIAQSLTWISILRKSKELGHPNWCLVTRHAGIKGAFPAYHWKS